MFVSLFELCVVGWIVIFVFVWDEVGVIGLMLLIVFVWFDYDDYCIYVGFYFNDCVMI